MIASKKTARSYYFLSEEIPTSPTITCKILSPPGPWSRYFHYLQDYRSRSNSRCSHVPNSTTIPTRCGPPVKAAELSYKSCCTFILTKLLSFTSFPHCYEIFSSFRARQSVVARNVKYEIINISRKSNRNKKKKSLKIYCSQIEWNEAPQKKTKEWRRIENCRWCKNSLMSFFKNFAGLEIFGLHHLS